MCGIAGFVNFEGHHRADAAARVARMTDSISYRGPDGAGAYIDDFAALGHRRLAIVDLAGGHQPMAALDGQVQIVFNGEIYNYLELQAELAGRGHTFETRSDTEVILHGYLEWGDRCVEKLNGMFAFAIWDARSKQLVLARDRVGKKPLYVYRNGPKIAFASELKALRVIGECPDEVDPEALDCYLTMGYIPAPRTIYRGVRKLKPAQVVTCSPQGWSERVYWQLQFGPPIVRGFDQVVEEFEALLDDAVKCRLMSEVPLGAFLSGGVDSSLVVSSMSRLVGTPVRTHTIGFDDQEFSELGAARAIATHLGTDHQEFVVQPRAVDVIEQIAEHFDEPLADASALPTWYVCEMTRRSVTVALSGDGGDEGFAGYSFRYPSHVLESRLRALLPVAARSLMFGPLGRLWPASANLPKPLRLKTIWENLAVSDAEAFYHDLIWLRSNTRASIYRPEFLRELHGFTPFETVAPHYLRNDAPDALGRSQFTDVNVYMTDDVLVKVDRMSMAHSLEVRCPLLDYRILEFAAKIPSGQKMSLRSGKLPLRALAAKRLPKEIHSLPKRGFSAPIAGWLREDLRATAEELVFQRGGVVTNMLDEQGVRRLWGEHLSGARDHSVFMWGLMMLGLWSRAGMRPTPSAA